MCLLQLCDVVISQYSATNVECCMIRCGRQWHCVSRNYMSVN
jgi:hypothetical protein